MEPQEQDEELTPTQQLLALALLAVILAYIAWFGYLVAYFVVTYILPGR